MSKENFKCPETNELFYVAQYKTKFREGKKIYTDSVGEELTNPKNKLVLIPLEKKWDGGFPGEGIGSDENGREKLKGILKKRSTEDFKKNHEWNRGRMIHNFDNKGEQGL